MTECDVLIVGGGIVGLYLARACNEKGLQVCVVETGGDADGTPQTKPSILFSARENLAAIEARNHILGGNSRYWGGALVEDDGALVTDLGLGEAGAKAFAAASDVVYSKVGIRRTLRERVSLGGLEMHQFSEFPVLTGKWRNVWSGQSADIAAEGIRVFLNTEVHELREEGGAKVALLKNSAGNETSVRYAKLVVSAGVVDSIRVLARLYPDLSNADAGFGRHMNDHLSLPVASFAWKRTPNLDRLFPPRFDKSVTVGRRVEFELPSGLKGFIHLQAPYDEVEPYRSLKRLVFARQLGLSAGEMLGAAFSLMKGGITTLRVGLDRFLKQRLFYPEGGQVNLLIDIESGSEAEKSINLSGDYVLNWSLSAADIQSLREASLFALDTLGAEVVSVAELARLNAFVQSEAFADYVENNCTEALHLGGGVQSSMRAAPGLGLKCQLSQDDSTFVVSTAIFPRAGIANPVHTLLVCAEMLSSHFKH